MRVLAGQVAIISGGLGDIGRSIASELASRGADIALGDVADASNIADLQRQLEANDIRSCFNAADVTDEAAVHRWVSDVEERLGTPTLIIVNAAVASFAGLREVKSQQWKRDLAVNLDGAFFLAQTCALRLLRKRQAGRIVFIGSFVADVPQTHIPAYCVSKAGLRMLCRCMAKDLATSGILVNEVAPGNVDAGLSRKFFDSHPGSRESCVQTIPIGLLISSVALQVAHLCEPSNTHMTGQAIVMDGGLSLGAGWTRS